MKTYVIPLNPIPWKRAGLAGHTFFDKQTKEKLAMGLYLIQQHGNDPKFKGPLKLDMHFRMPIPKSISKRKHSEYQSTYPDIDNLIKMVLDTINNTETIWEDDKQVAEISSTKIYDTKPRTIIIISEIL
jgi:Holliday junction resolvase RusA-like endonuclease